ncbi:glycoside hydrolase family 16 protein [Hydrogenophaga sp.]|uniref:glycoside hydrolase family 16 protein n=1 Tax=Hydrogenophaga sp. TaxID=1904254 RepID=UPI003F6B22C1
MKHAVWVGGVMLLAACGGGQDDDAPNADAAVTVPNVSVGQPTALPAPAVPKPPEVPSIEGWRLVWNDEFNTDGAVDSSKWAFDTHRNKDGWYNGELQYYSKDRAENARVEDGKLIITAQRERLTTAPDYGNQNYTSARLYTKGKASWTYGRWEVRAKLPCALGTWPAIWTLGDGIPDTGVWPLDGEIDIMEQKGFDAGEKTRVLGTVHTQAFHAGGSKGETVSLPTACSDFNTYQMEWDEDRIRIGVNGSFYFTYANPKNGNVNEWPFFRPQHLLLNVAVGGVLGGTVRDDQLPASMEIDYVRVYQR